MFYIKYSLALLFIGAGFYHFIKPYFFMKIMPTYLPYHLPLVYISGGFEVLCGVLLLFPETQKIGAILSIFLLIAVFPANIQMAQLYYQKKLPFFWLTLLRLPLQFVLLYFAYLLTKK